MKMIKYNDRIIIVDGRDPLSYFDMQTKKLYKYPAYIDEASELPNYKWWRNPVKWYKWRKVLKIADKNTKFVLQTTPQEPNPFWKKSELE